jgi:hypothetical protein
MEQTNTTARRANLLRDLSLYRADLTAAEAEYQRCERLVTALESPDMAYRGLGDEHLADAKRMKDRAWTFAEALGVMVAAIEEALNELL